MISLAANRYCDGLRGGGLSADAQSRLRSAIGPLLAIALLIPSQALAQAYQCRMPQSISIPQVRADGPTRQIPVTGYTLALSWSPEFCKGREMDARQRTQCSGRNGRFGLVVHGLWPDGRSTWPQWCPSERAVSPAEARKNLCMMPFAGLISRQWSKHGSCMVRRPEVYFRVTRILWESLRIPDYDYLSRQEGLTAGLSAVRFQMRTASIGSPGWSE